MKAPDWRAWRARSRWLHWVVCGLGLGNVVLGNVVEGLVMLTICVLVERGLDWLNRTDHELQARIDALRADLARNAASGTPEGPPDVERPGAAT